ncbi:hypothetical protein D9758_016403 [Tetrapyrgos nigripes]|uniref:Uncharacterized protein n=1 Tax=Tetrapyrgos nigripes TaxID=182062 RepID=A0A8H5CMV2_9AGAR|nr:hypothetical protein D9758_016403 [Tetrapyrgos nigripes]
MVMERVEREMQARVSEIEGKRERERVGFAASTCATGSKRVHSSSSSASTSEGGFSFSQPPKKRPRVEESMKEGEKIECRIDFNEEDREYQVKKALSLATPSSDLRSLQHGLGERAENEGREGKGKWVEEEGVEGEGEASTSTSTLRTRSRGLRRMDTENQMFNLDDEGEGSPESTSSSESASTTTTTTTTASQPTSPTSTTTTSSSSSSTPTSASTTTTTATPSSRTPTTTLPRPNCRLNPPHLTPPRRPHLPSPLPPIHLFIRDRRKVVGYR